MSDGPYDFAREIWEAANAPEAVGRSRHDRPGANEDIPTAREAAEDA